MAVFTDQLGRQVELLHVPQRIISLVPSQTELLYDLDLGEAVTGITKFCIHPDAWFRTKTRIGGTKTLHLEKIRELRPDLILANREENLREQIEALEKDFPVWTSDINDLDTALGMITSIGDMVGRKVQALDITGRISASFQTLTVPKKYRTCYLIWNNPMMTIGGDSFINDMMHRAGFENVFGDRTRYPEITIEQIREKNVELLLLSSEPFPFRQKHADVLGQHLPGTRIVLADGEMFSWYGSRLLHSAGYFRNLHMQLND